MVFDGVHCETNAEIDTDTGEVNCIDNEAGDQYTFELVEQPTAGKVAVFATRFFRIEQSIQVRVIGKRPLPSMTTRTCTRGWSSRTRFGFSV